MQIAIDGPAGAGKSTVARAVAKRLGYTYLDTGAMYRALALGVSRLGIEPADRAAVISALPQLTIDVTYDADGQQHTWCSGTDVSAEIRTAQAGSAASAIALIPEVRLHLVEEQRKIAERSNVVMDGRDIGSYVLPNAQFKFFVTASVKARAKRRALELEERGETCDLHALERDIMERDRQDMERDFAPLTHTDGEILVDTSDMTQEQVVEFLLKKIYGAS